MILTTSQEKIIMKRLSSLCIIVIVLLGAVACDLQCDQAPSTLDKIDCHPERGANEAECLRRGCCWLQPRSALNETSSDENDDDDPPSCFFPANFNCYNIKLVAAVREQEHDSDDDDDDKHLAATGSQQCSGFHKQSMAWILERRTDCPASGFHDDAKRLKLELNVYGLTIMNIKISEPDRHRFEPKLPEINLPAQAASTTTTPEAEDGICNSSHLNDKASDYLLFGGFGSKDELLRVELNPSSGLLKVTHQNTAKILFEAHLQKLIYSRRFVQLPTKLGSPLVYGLGQHFGDSLTKKRSKTYTMFNYGHPPQSDGRSSYSSYPFYINILSLASSIHHNNTSQSADGRKLMATGALMLNSNAMDIVLRSRSHTSDAGSITWRLSGGLVNLFLFCGPEPHDVIRQYQSLVGRPTLPPAWALGYHQSRLNYLQLLPIKQAWARTRSAGIPMESVWTDLDFLWHTTSYSLDNPELNDLVRALQDQFGMHYVTIVDPAISLSEDPSSYEALKLATSMNIFAYNSPEERPLGGESSPSLVNSWVEKGGLIDFTHSEIVPYLKAVLQEYKQKLNFDGLWLDMNEPELNFNYQDGKGRVCAHDEELQYWPGGRNLNDRTLCMAAQFEAGEHYDVHNLYAFYQSKAHYEALRAMNSSRRPLLISRAQFVGQGKYSGSWLGDLGSSFEQMRWSVLGTIESNWFGQPMTGADICGFFGSTTDELCARWFSLGAFYPLARNHNDGATRDQDPAALDENVERSARVALLKRYSLLPYLYTLFYENHLRGRPVVSSMVFSFFESFQTKSDLSDLSQFEDQLVWGGSLVFAPVLEAGAQTRHVYLPGGRWYDVSIGLPGTDLNEGPYDALRSNWPTASATSEESQCSGRVNDLRKPIESLGGCLLQDQCSPLGTVNIYQRGGSIIPTFRRVSHEDSIDSIWRKALFFLEVALDENENATGTLYWDSGESEPGSQKYDRVCLDATRNQLVITMCENNYSEYLKFDGFVVYGIKLNDSDLPETDVYKDVKLIRTYDAEREILTCQFKSLTGEQDHYLTLRRFETLLIIC